MKRTPENIQVFDNQKKTFKYVKLFSRFYEGQVTAAQFIDYLNNKSNELEFERKKIILTENPTLREFGIVSKRYMAFIAPLRCANASLPYDRQNRLIMPPAKRNRAFPTGNALLYISLSYVDLIASFTSNAILNDLFAICNSRLLPTNRSVNCDGRVRPQGAPCFCFTPDNFNGVLL